MHGEREVSLWPRRTWVAAHLALLAVNGWLTVGAGVETFGWEAGDPARRWTLATFGAVLWVRMTFMALRLLKRRFGWEEAIGSGVAVAIYQVGFALVGATNPEPMGWPEAAGLGLFVLGSATNTGAELQRWRFKRDPSHANRLYTGGRFAVVRHPNYLGDILWVSGWALGTGEPLALLVPLGLAGAFVTYFIPAISAHLERRYGDAYVAWSARTPRLIPWLY